MSDELEIVRRAASATEAELIQSLLHDAGIESVLQRAIGGPEWGPSGGQTVYVQRADIERAGGQLVAVAGRVNGKMSIGIVAYQLGAENSKPRLRELAAQTLADFDLTGEII